MFKQFFAEADLTLPQFRSSYKDWSITSMLITNAEGFAQTLDSSTIQWWTSQGAAMLGVCFEPWPYEKEANQGKSTKEDSFLPDLKPLYLWESGDWKLETLTFCSSDVSLGLWRLPETFKENKCFQCPEISSGVRHFIGGPLHLPVSRRFPSRWRVIVPYRVELGR